MTRTFWRLGSRYLEINEKKTSDQLVAGSGRQVQFLYTRRLVDLLLPAEEDVWLKTNTGDMVVAQG